MYCPTTDTWTLLEPRLAGPVYRGRACLVDRHLVCAGRGCDLSTAARAHRDDVTRAQICCLLP